MTKLTQEQIVKNIDHQIDRWWDLSHKKNLTEEEILELNGRAVKITLFKSGAKLDGISLQKYLSLTEREWGNKSLKEDIPSP